MNPRVLPEDPESLRILLAIDLRLPLFYIFYAKTDFTLFIDF